jgi:hypothetical protein
MTMRPVFSPPISMSKKTRTPSSDAGEVEAADSDMTARERSE